MRISDTWRETTPEPLQPAIEHIRANFDNSLWIATSSDRKCHETLTAKTASLPEPAIFQQYFNLLAKSICDLAGKTFTLVLQLAIRNQIEKPIEWARSQVTLMLEDELLLSEAMRIRNWIVIACDGRDRPRPKSELGRAAEEAWLFNRDWQSPAWLCMKPLGNFVYDAPIAWVRDSLESSQGALEFHSNICSIQVESYLKQLAGQAEVERALAGVPSRNKPGDARAIENLEVADIESAPRPNENLSGIRRMLDSGSRFFDNFWLEQQEQHRRKMESIDREIERARELAHAREMAEIKRPETPTGVTADSAVRRSVAGDINEVGSPNALGDITRPENRFERDGDTWAIKFAGETCRLPASLIGLDYISVLLRYAGTSIGAQQLRAQGAAAVPVDPGRLSDMATDPDAGLQTEWTPHAVLDETTIANYQNAINVLNDRITYAQDTGNTREVETLEKEKDDVLRELSKQKGLPGRPREFANQKESARSTVTHALKLAFKKIEKTAPNTAKHLRDNIATGTFLAYSDRSVRWKT